MNIALLYFDDCPNWKIADERLAFVAADRPDLRVSRHLVETLEEAITILRAMWGGGRAGGAW